jgi:hypothetical protein
VRFINNRNRVGTSIRFEWEPSRKEVITSVRRYRAIGVSVVAVEISKFRDSIDHDLTLSQEISCEKFNLEV